MDKIIVIVGPTAVGKSGLALKLAQKLNGEIINADSMQVYKEMSIGTAKPTDNEMLLVPHHLFNIRSISEDFSVASFQKLINEKIKEVIAKNKTPIVVGGTGLYVKAFLYGYVFEEYENKSINSDLELMTNQELYDLLFKIDPESTNKIHLNNRKRLIRAIEIFNSSGEPKSKLEAKQNKLPIYNATLFGLTMSRDKLYERINTRVDDMIIQGLAEEAKKVLNFARKNSTALQAIGYKEFTPLFSGEESLDKVKDKIKKNTRNYAKRQYTFFNNQFKMNWINLDESSEEEAIKIIEKAFKGETNV